MFFPRTVPLELTGVRLRGLRLSLNTPVVSTQELPVGPARAALLVHDEPDGRPNVTVGVRSLRTGTVVLYSYEGDLREESSLDVGVDGALSFAESMGFLFDEDEIGDGLAPAKVRALGLWSDLMGQPGVTHVADGRGSPDAPSEPPRRAAEADAGAGAAAWSEEEDPFGEPSDLEAAGLAQFDGDPVLAETSEPERGAFAMEREAPRRGDGAYVPQFEGDTGSDGALVADEAGADVFGDGDVSLRGLEGFEFEGDGDASDGPVLDLGAEGVEIGGGDGEGVPLSKFRGAGAAPAPVAGEPTSPGRTTLARLKLVRRERDDGRPHPIARLFGAF